MGRPPLNPDGPMTAAERQARRRERVGKSINRRRRTLRKIANETERKQEKRQRRASTIANRAEATRTATAALVSPAMPLCDVLLIDPPPPHESWSEETGADRAVENHMETMT